MVKRKRNTMISGEHARIAGLMIKAAVLSLALLIAPQVALAQAAAPAAVAPVALAAPAAEPAQAAPAAAASDHFAVAPGGYVPMKPTPGKGMPVDGGYTLQAQYSPTGNYGLWMHDRLLMPLITLISVFVLGLLLYVMFRFNKRANPVPSKTSHNTLIEVVWIGIPTLILLGVAVPSIDLLAKQFKPAPAKALTIKATGNQWFWSYSYPDNGGFEVISNMMPVDEAARRGEPPQLAADLRMVVPVGEPIRMQITAADVIHSFGVPSLWFKLDGVPGRINEKVLFVKEPGVYYGQCSELCGARHGYMPITVEALPRPQFNAWVMAQSGGVIDGTPKPVVAAPAAATAAPVPAPAAASPVPAVSASPAPAA
jgi:cytochrome c oxidase subunit II